MLTPRGRPAVLRSLPFLAFVGLGLPDGALGVAWPAVRSTFALPIDALGALLVSVTAGYVASSALAGRLLARIDLGLLLALSCSATAASLAGTAAAPSWGVLVALGVVSGLGAGAIDAGLNAHVASHHPPRTLNLLHAFYGLGTCAGPALMTRVLAAGSSWRTGYAILAAAQLGLALAFLGHRASLVPVVAAAPLVPAPAAVATLARPAAWLGIACFFCYVGLEASAGAWTYSLLFEGRGFSMAAAGAATSLFWGGLMLGRLGLAVLRFEPPLGRLLRLSIAGAVLGSALVAVDRGPIATLAGLLILGVACGPIFPSLMAATPRRLGRAHAAHAVGFQVAGAALGQALMPALLGALAARRGLEAVAVATCLAAVVLLALCEVLERVAPAGDPDLAGAPVRPTPRAALEHPSPRPEARP